MGAQDDFEYARRFLADTGIETPSMLYDPSGLTWQAFGVRFNSQMLLMAADLSSGTELIYGFDEAQQQAILDFVDTL